MRCASRSVPSVVTTSACVSPRVKREINFRANIDALKRAGVTDVISVSAVGSLREDLSPGTFVIVDQFIDRTFAREKSFFGTGLVAHVSMAHPVCDRLGNHLETAARESGIKVNRGSPAWPNPGCTEAGAAT